MNIQCDNVVEAKRTDLILVDKKVKSCIIIHVAIPGDCRIREKEIKKIEKSQNFKRELKKFWFLKKVEVVPVIVGALRCILEWYKNQSCWEQLGYLGKSYM